MVFINAEEEHKKHYAEIEWFLNFLHKEMVNVRMNVKQNYETREIETFVTDELDHVIKDFRKWLKLRLKYLCHEIEMTMKTFPEWYMERTKLWTQPHVGTDFYRNFRKQYTKWKNEQKLWETIHEMEEEDDPSNILQ